MNAYHRPGESFRRALRLALLALLVFLLAGCLPPATGEPLRVEVTNLDTLAQPAAPPDAAPSAGRGMTNFNDLTVNDLHATGDLTVDGATTYTGVCSYAGGAAWNTGAFTTSLAALGTFAATGAATLNGGLAMDTNRFTVADTSGNTLIAGSLAANGGITADSTAFTVADTTGAVTTASSASIGTWVKLGAQTAVVVTAGSIITPTGTFQPLTSTGAQTCSTTTCIANGATAGDVLILRNANASDAITIDGTGANVECKTDKVLGAQDTLTLIWNGSDWVCLSLSDNS
jgi:hypothetical protein